jgi:septum site-determining protein MinC
VVDRTGLHRRADAAADRFAEPQVRLRGRNVLALVVAPEFPLGDWFAALDRLRRARPDVFAGRPVVVDLRATLAEGGAEAVGIVLDGLEARDLKLIAAEGVTPKVLAASRWGRLATRLQGRDQELDDGALDSLSPKEIGEAKPAEPVEPERPVSARAEPPASAGAEPTALVIERPVRSGESIVFPGGDVTIVGSVSSGAEVRAGGSIHVYGALRGRALAGLRTGAGARIFCRKLEAELIGVDQLYRTAEHWGQGLHGHAVQVYCDRGSLRLVALD